jgi:hypothetical protein
LPSSGWRVSGPSRVRAFFAAAVAGCASGVIAYKLLRSGGG